MSKFKLVFVSIVVLPSLLWAWGGTGHKLINKNAVVHLPSSMQRLIDQQSYLETHSVDADNRKSTDPTEDVKHFIDIDVYPNFQNRVLSFDSLATVYSSNGGASYVTNEGTVPWTTKTTVDSLTAQFRRADWAKAYLTASDLGHYVGDGHQPLHLTNDYDGKLSGHSGIHSRYESTMFNAYATSITVVRDSVKYVADPLAFAFGYIDRITVYKDSIFAADTKAKAAAGGSTSSSAYTAALWAETGAYTKMFIQQATVDLASLWYTAWVNAGLLVVNTTDVAESGSAAVPEAFSLAQNYPNPFNPSTNIRFRIGSAQFVTLEVYDMLGRGVAQLVNRELPAGSYTIQWNASASPSGVYYCRLQAGAYSAVQKMIYQK